MFATVHDNLMLVQGEGSSMHPTIREKGDVMLVEKISVKLKLISPGDVVVSLNPWDLAGKEGAPLICKRVVAIEGNKVPIADNFMTDLVGKDFFSNFQKPVPLNSVFLAGDNSAFSIDSRQMGPIPLSLVQGRVLMRIYPDFSLLKKLV